MVETTAQQQMQTRTSSVSSTRRRRRRMSVLWLAAALAITLPAATCVDAQATTTTTTTTIDSATTGAVGQFVLQCSAKSTAASNVIEIVHKNDDGTNISSMSDVQTIPASLTWSLGAWDTSIPKLESQLKTLVPSLTRLDLTVQFQQSLKVQSLVFEHSAMQWSYGPTLVFTEDSLKGLASLQNLSFARFNVSFDDKSWLPASAPLKQLVFDQCTVPFFTIDTAAVITEAVFRGSNLTSFPTFLLNLKTPLTTLKLENNRIARPITMTSKEFDLLKLIKVVSFTGNDIASKAETPATTTAASAGGLSTNVAPASSIASCDNQKTYEGLSICVSEDLTFRSANKTLTDSSDSSDSSGANAPATASSSASSSKLMNSVIIILSVCGVAVLVIGSVVYRRQRRSTALSGDTRSSFYENSDVLLSPSKLEPVVPAAAAGASAGAIPNKDDSPVLHTQASSSQVAVADLDLGREVIHLGKKLGIHGLRKGEYRDEPVVALRLSLRALHISMREVNRIVSSYVPFRHRNIVTLIGTSMTALEDLLIVVEYMAKGSLRSVLRNPKVELPWHDRVRMSTDICSAIEFLHSTRSGLVSKNLTSKSILCTAELVCKLDIFDYGRKVRDHVVPVLNFGQCEIATRAPEVLAGGAVTRAAEVYALGVIFCEISLRQMPFEDIVNDRGATLGDLFIAREVAAQRLQLTPADGAPREYKDLATRCLAFDPASRPNVTEILQVLRTL